MVKGSVCGVLSSLLSKRRYSSVLAIENGGNEEMFDDFREWLSDNLRYILLGLAVILVIIILFCIVRLVTSGSRKGPANEQPGQTNTKVESVTENEGSDEPANQAPTSTESLSRNDAAILTLVQKYYDAVAAKDVATLSQIVSPWNDSVQESILANDVIEKYNNITTYSKQGLDAGAYVVYVYFEGKVADYETLVPSLSRLYVTTSDGGDLVISYGSSLDSDVADYINTVSADDDVRALREDVNRQYEEALASDPDLKAFIDTLDTGSADENAAEEETEEEQPATPTEMTAIAGLNIRETPSTSANILGSVANGTNVTILEDAGDGWVKIHYTAGGSDVTGYVRLEYLTDVAA